VSNQPFYNFAPGRPFYTMVTSFMAASAGLGPVFAKDSPLAFQPGVALLFTGIVVPDLHVRMEDIRATCTSQPLTGHEAAKSLCCMLVNSAYCVAEDSNDHSPDFEVFRHFRNAASHGNKFFFKPWEPARPASWRGFTIDHKMQGAQNPLHGTEFIGTAASAADVIVLLSDIEPRLP
jgi:hypothetical protein